MLLSLGFQGVPDKHCLEFVITNSLLVMTIQRVEHRNIRTQFLSSLHLNFTDLFILFSSEQLHGTVKQRT